MTNLVHGEQCSHYQITVIPGTNTFIGIVNQTCKDSSAFCPCSMVSSGVYNRGHLMFLVISKIYFSFFCVFV